MAKGLVTRGYNGQPQPRANNMNKLEWDDDLAEMAQRWSDQCRGGHDRNRLVPEFSEFPNVGQNVALRTTWPRFAGHTNVSEFATLWFDEVFSSFANNSFSSIIPKDSF